MDCVGANIAPFGICSNPTSGNFPRSCINRPEGKSLLRASWKQSEQRFSCVFVRKSILNPVDRSKGLQVTSVSTAVPPAVEDHQSPAGDINRRTRADGPSALADDTPAAVSISPPPAADFSRSKSEGSAEPFVSDTNAIKDQEVLQQADQKDSSEDPLHTNFEDIEALISNTEGLDLRSVCLASSKRPGVHFLAPLGIRRHLPLLLYIPGLDGTVNIFTFPLD